MADLPREQVTSSPPFTYSGVDNFGPFYIKQGSKNVKRYGIARRGPVREIRSDQGTNLVGTERELKKALWTTTQSKEVFAESPLLIGLSNGSRILRESPIWVAYGSAS